MKAEIKNKLAIGKRNEFAIWGYLLGEVFDVFPSLVGDKGIDGIVGHEGRYFEVQIKSGENWNNQRGLSRAAVSVNPDRIFLIYNTLEDEVRYFTGRQILDEAEWQKSIDYSISQIKLPKRMLEKYQAHDWAGFFAYLRS
ncbi:hypothetical protein RHM65_18405 [Pseudomonas sp. CCI4.2]|uniref:hypothetical protein n=1 Tax=Pseudomonas sp. CCI4.2 TaxID=3048620 RepID=UPI002AC9D1F1|nr:hypothetical protein [Pseudomonas sp. CCI4.2]MEB0092934.1 hypothetical protein [Pseudomonas sp. CCI4.2]WPX52776.1 hypothetical protein RHM65_18405 [Pseudomonas sp. CCI4.2]